MDKIIKIPVDAGKVTISEDTKSILPLIGWQYIHWLMLMWNSKRLFP